MLTTSPVLRSISSIGHGGRGLQVIPEISSDVLSSKGGHEGNSLHVLPGIIISCVKSCITPKAKSFKGQGGSSLQVTPGTKSTFWFLKSIEESTFDRGCYILG